MNTLTNFAEKSLCGKTVVSGDQMAKPACDAGLEMYQLSSLITPGLSKSFAAGGSASNVLLAGTRAYINPVTRWTGQLGVLEVGSHSQPTLVGAGPTPVRLEAVIEGCVYFFDSYWDDQSVHHDDLRSYDARNPAQISLTKTVSLSGGSIACRLRQRNCLSVWRCLMRLMPAWRWMRRPRVDTIGRMRHGHRWQAPAWTLPTIR